MRARFSREMKPLVFFTVLTLSRLRRRSSSSVNSKLSAMMPVSSSSPTRQSKLIVLSLLYS